jgi:hypothetical protein
MQCDCCIVDSQQLKINYNTKCNRMLRYNICRLCLIIVNNLYILQSMHPVVCINISVLYIWQHNNQINNSLPQLCQLRLF